MYQLIIVDSLRNEHKDRVLPSLEACTFRIEQLERQFSMWEHDMSQHMPDELRYYEGCDLYVRNGNRTWVYENEKWLEESS